MLRAFVDKRGAKIINKLMKLSSCHGTELLPRLCTPCCPKRLPPNKTRRHRGETTVNVGFSVCTKADCESFDECLPIDSTWTRISRDVATFHSSYCIVELLEATSRAGARQIAQAGKISRRESTRGEVLYDNISALRIALLLTVYINL